MCNLRFFGWGGYENLFLEFDGAKLELLKRRRVFSSFYDNGRSLRWMTCFPFWAGAHGMRARVKKRKRERDGGEEGEEKEEEENERFFFRAITLCVRERRRSSSAAHLPSDDVVRVGEHAHILIFFSSLALVP